MNRDVRFEVDGKMFGRRDEAGSDSDITVFFAAQRTGMLELSAFGILGMWFGTVRVIDGKDTV